MSNYLDQRYGFVCNRCDGEWDDHAVLDLGHSAYVLKNEIVCLRCYEDALYEELQNAG